jgi:hypothetical protein
LRTALENCTFYCNTFYCGGNEKSLNRGETNNGQVHIGLDAGRTDAGLDRPAIFHVLIQAGNVGKSRTQTVSRMPSGVSRNILQNLAGHLPRPTLFISKGSQS